MTDDDETKGHSVETLGDQRALKVQRAGHHSSFDLMAFLFAVLSISLLIAVAVGRIIHAELTEEFTILLFGFLGLGSAPLQLLPSMKGYRFFVTAIGIGLGVVLLIGFALIELRVWWIGPPLFIVLAVAAAFLHLRAIYRNVFHITRRTFRLSLSTLELGSRDSIVVFVTTTLGLGVSLASVLVNQHLIPKPGGIPTSITPIWFVGLAILLGSFTFAWIRRHHLLVLPALSLALILTITPSIVYEIARYDWTQSHIGLTLYFLQRGTANSHLSLYQSWPGFFGGIAWLCHVVGASNIEALARWWPPFIDLIGAIIVQYLSKAFGVSNRNSWLAAILFITGNTIGQDYYSPQAIAYVGFLAILAISLRSQEDTGELANDDSRVLAMMDWILAIASLS